MATSDLGFAWHKYNVVFVLVGLHMRCNGCMPVRMCLESRWLSWISSVFLSLVWLSICMHVCVCVHTVAWPIHGLCKVLATRLYAEFHKLTWTFSNVCTRTQTHDSNTEYGYLWIHPVGIAGLCLHIRVPCYSTSCATSMSVSETYL